MNELEQNNQNATAKIAYDTLLAAGLFYRCGWCGQPEKSIELTDCAFFLS